MADGVFPVFGVGRQCRAFLRLVGSLRRRIVQIGEIDVVVAISDVLHGLFPSLVGRHNHRIVAVLAIDVGIVQRCLHVVLVENGVEIGEMTIDDGTRRALRLVEFQHVVAVEIVADRVDGELLVVKRLQNVRAELQLAADGVEHAIDTRHIGLCHGDTVHRVVAVAFKDEMLQVEHGNRPPDLARSRIVVAGDVVLHKLFQHCLVALVHQGFVVEGVVERSPDREGLRGFQEVFVARFLHQCCKLRQAGVDRDVFPDGCRGRAFHGTACVVVLVPILTGGEEQGGEE